MASVGVVRSSLGFQNETSTSGDADRLPNEMSNMSIRDDNKVLCLRVVDHSCLLLYCQLLI
jgi:hypothetical protein